MKTDLFSSLVTQLPWLERVLLLRNSVFAVDQSREVWGETVGQGIEKFLWTQGSFKQKTLYSYKGFLQQQTLLDGEWGSSNQLEAFSLLMCSSPNPSHYFYPRRKKQKTFNVFKLPWYKISRPFGHRCSIYYFIAAAFILS